MVCFLLKSLYAQGGHGGGHGSGTACIVKGSYCQCHYCKCEKGHVSCKGYGHEKGYGNVKLFHLDVGIYRIAVQKRRIKCVDWSF